MPVADRPPRLMTSDRKAEVDLVRRARQGEADAFGQLHARYENVVASVVRAETRNASDASDIVQEVFLLAWSRLGSLRDPERFRAWLLQIARRAVIDHSRVTGRRVALDHDDDLTIARAASSDPDPAELVELADLVGRLRGALDDLSRRDAVALTLAAQFGFGPAEIAQALQITPNNAKVVLHRARRRLRMLVADLATAPALTTSDGRVAFDPQS